MKRALVAIASCITLLSCANIAESPLNSDLVRDSSTAIHIGQNTCAPEDAAFVKGDWQAEYHGGVWRVWFYAPGSSYGPTYEAEVRARDGKSDKCTIKVKAD